MSKNFTVSVGTSDELAATAKGSAKGLVARMTKRALRDAKLLVVLTDPNSDPKEIEKIVARKRASMRRSFFGAFNQLGGMPVSIDTYKRFMAAADQHFALEHAGYALTLRKGLPEIGAGDQFVMAGHEMWLQQCFGKPMRRVDIEIARHFMSKTSNVKVFPHQAWDTIMQGQGDDIRWPVDVWGFPGGQTFLKGVPAMFFEGPGAAVSYLEAQICRYFVSIIWATKARVMGMVTPRDAEFGLRAAYHELLSVGLQICRFIGSGGKAKLTSNDLVEFMYPELSAAIGTLGHELICSLQTFDKTLAQAEFEALDGAVETMGGASLLADLVDAMSIGLENVIKVMKKHPNAKLGSRVDSGDIKAQCVMHYRRFKAEGRETSTIVFEDEVTPELVKEVYDHFRAETGVEPTMLFPGAGGYWYKIHRDMVSAAFKRTATGKNPNVKFSNSPGKESTGGYLRVYGCGSTMLVADKSESIDGEPLYQKLVTQGKIVYRESFQRQAQRSDATWGKYTKVEYSPLIQSYRDTFASMREKEVSDARERLIAQGWDWLKDAA